MYFEQLIKLAYAQGIEEIQECRPFYLPQEFKPGIKNFFGDGCEITTIHRLDMEKARKSDDEIIKKGLNTIEDILETSFPFPICSFEMADELAELARGSEEAKNSKIEGLKILCIAVIEKTPTEFEYLILLQKNMHSPRVLHLYQGDKTEGTELWMQMAESACKALSYFLRKTSCAVENTRVRFKIKNLTEKKTVTIRKIVHVRPKKENAEIIPVYGGTIDYSHRFEVRGHWRILKDGIGKDRSGNYNVKGNENLPLVKKTRIISNEFLE